MRTRCRRGDIVGFALILSISATLFAWTQLAYSADGENWALASAVHVEKQADITADTYNTVPAIPCETQTFSKKTVSNKPAVTYSACAVGMSDAYFENSSSVPGWFRSFSSETTYRLEVSSLANPRIFAVPNSRSLILNSWAFQNYQSLPSGLHIIRDYQNTLSDGALDSYGNKTYTPTKPFDFELRDPSGALVPIAQNGLKFSINGEWMIFRLTYNGQSAWARLNLDTYELLSFATPLQSQYAVYDAISNDGRYVVLYEPLSTLRVYDLERCGITVNKFQSHQCAYTDLYSSVKSTLDANEIGFKNFRFIGDKKISFYATTRKAGEATWSYGDFTMRYGEEDTSNGYLAMGDSFSSGEGAYNYRPETDFHVDNSLFNRCHQSKSSYPYILSNANGFERFGSVACSGAKIKDIEYNSVNPRLYEQEGDPQAVGFPGVSNDSNILKMFIPGYREQIRFLSPDSVNPRIATISIGGNDVGFADILKQCVNPAYILSTCYTERSQREILANIIDLQIPRLTGIYKSIKTQADRPDFRLYVIGYPRMVNVSGACGPNVGMDLRERNFADSLVNYLNDAIRVAATRAGVRYVDVSDAFVDEATGRNYQLCGNQQGLAINGLVIFGKSSKKPQDINYQESYHPNLLGHSQLAQTINQATQGLTQAMPPEPQTLEVVERGEGLRRALVGDNEKLIETKHPGYDPNIVSGSPIRGEQLQYKSSSSWPTAKPGTKVQIELHSTPTNLGETQVNEEGYIEGSVMIPEDVEPGYHELHVKYNNFFGESVDQYQIVYVQASADDSDGDGLTNSADPCPTSAQSGIDADKDGIDDACDDEYVAKAKTELPPVDRQVDSTPYSSSSTTNKKVDDMYSSSESVSAEIESLDRAAVLSDTDTNTAVTKFNRTGVIELWVAIALGIIAVVALLITRMYFKNVS